MNLPEAIENYINASNQHDIGAMSACFSQNATVHDEGGTHQGKIEIESWIRDTIAKYEFRLKPVNVSDSSGNQVCVSCEVSGAFQGSPIHLDFHFELEDTKISSLAIKNG